MSTPIAVRVGALALAALAVALFALWRRHTDGHARAVQQHDVLTAADLGVELGRRLTFVQFSSPTCGPCVVARRHLSKVAAQHDDVVHVELDVSEHLELTRRLHVLRTPTVVCCDGEGRVMSRITGVPSPGELAALASPAKHAQEVAA